MKFITNGNWGLKLLALALAIIVYYAIKPNTSDFTDRNDRHLFKSR